MANPDEPVTAATAPIKADVIAGKTVFWCACGRSAKQPFCDGSHKGTAFTPVAYKPEKDGAAYFCACKRTGNQPLCDGTHNRLTG
jgi:CDGSH-type Zn-finger protein